MNLTSPSWSPCGKQLQAKHRTPLAMPADIMQLSYGWLPAWRSHGTSDMMHEKHMTRRNPPYIVEWGLTSEYRRPLPALGFKLRRTELRPPSFDLRRSASELRHPPLAPRLASTSGIQRLARGALLSGVARIARTSTPWSAGANGSGACVSSTALLSGRRDARKEARRAAGRFLSERARRRSGRENRRLRLLPG